jgi:hypothetical protein
MNSRERLSTLLRGGIPDCVPVAPDFSNMIPARRTDKPFWDLYLYKDPPIWEAYIDTAKYFDIDAVMDGYFPMQFPTDHQPDERQWEPFIISRNEEHIVVQKSCLENGKRIWKESVDVYYVADPPTEEVKLETLGLPPEPEFFEAVEGVKEVDNSPAGLGRVMELMGDQGPWFSRPWIFSNNWLFRQ